MPGGMGRHAAPPTRDGGARKPGSSASVTSRGLASAQAASLGCDLRIGLTVMCGLRQFVASSATALHSGGGKDAGLATVAVRRVGEKSSRITGRIPAGNQHHWGSLFWRERLIMVTP
jgi:hypothetical protein